MKDILLDIPFILAGFLTGFILINKPILIIPYLLIGILVANWQNRLYINMLPKIPPEHAEGVNEIMNLLGADKLIKSGRRRRYIFDTVNWPLVLLKLCLNKKHVNGKIKVYQKWE